MKQLIQDVKSGETSVLQVPPPQVAPGHVLVRNSASLVSAGTERTLVDFANKNLARKAMARPDLVRQVLDKASREGILTALDAVRSKLGQLLALGYSSAGTIIEVGEDVPDLKVGDRVACAGFGHACHAEIVNVPRLLTVAVPLRPDSTLVPLEEAAFTTLGAIALQGIRLSEAKLGETVAVIGLGLLGQLTVQMLKTAGCRVIGIDLQESRCSLANQLGADATTSSAELMRVLCSRMTDGHGADSVLITADTSSDEPVILAGELGRRRAIVVAVGAVGMHIPRKIYYEKELDFRVSRSYGPGRYDPEYEEKGHDYPISYVRWTENRNMAAFVSMVASGAVNVGPLITHRYEIEDGPTAYQLITGALKQPFMGVVLTYPAVDTCSTRINLNGAQRAATSEVTVGMLGAGNFAVRSLLPAMKKTPSVVLKGICSGAGLTARVAAEKFGFEYCASATSEIINDSAVNTVVIATRHNLHAQQLVESLNSGKHVFCEKPMCLNESELSAIISAYGDAAARSKPPILMVGYNRRFAPLAIELRQALASNSQPMVIQYRVNGGSIPVSSWIQDPILGGGRILGEVCHFVDLMTFLCGSQPVSVYAEAMDNAGEYRDDNVVITIRFGNGSIGTITYTANGDKAFSKERVEVFCGGMVAVLDDFRKLTVTRGGKTRNSSSLLRQDKGHEAEWVAFANSITKGLMAPIGFVDLVGTSLVTLYALQSIRDGARYQVDANLFVETHRTGHSTMTSQDIPTS
jgi:predicted dehydrogenase/threonine dehydrogenase-like Zn-dependent dehydrogenase